MTAEFNNRQVGHEGEEDGWIVSNQVIAWRGRKQSAQ